MQGQDTIEVIGCDVDIAVALLINCHRFSRTGTIDQAAGDHIAVGAGGQTGVQILGQIVQVVVDRQEALVAAAEGDLVVPIVPPPGNTRVSHGILEAHHCVDLSPTVLANPTIHTGPILIELGGNNPLLRILWRGSIVIVKGKGAHHPADAIGIGQMEGGGHLVLPGGLVVQHGARIPLVVMVVHKG